MRFLSLLSLGLVLVGCDAVTSTASSDVAAASHALASADDADDLFATNADESFDNLAAIVDRVNLNLEAAGSQYRMNYPWLFRVGPGTDPFGRLRTGARWTQPTSVTYIIDESDYTTDVPAGEVESALVSSFESWNEIRNTDLLATRLADDGENYDILDGVVRDEAGACVDILDVTSPNGVFQIDPATGVIQLRALKAATDADIIVGGWLAPEYFADCLGSASILGVTFSFSFGDRDSDNYVDRVYVEQFYNEGYRWVTEGARFLRTRTTGFDIETVAVHENGHAHGLGHFGGPINNQPFKLQPNGKVFNPQAVMNPFYLGGEERDPLKTDVAGFRALYAGGR